MSQHKEEFIDIVSENFVNAYINKFNPKIIECIYMDNAEIQLQNW